MRTHLLVLAALALAPNPAHAEFAARASSDVRAPTARIIAEPITVDHMLGKIHSKYMPGLRRCYNRGLARDPSLACTATLMFTVNPYGRVTGAVTGIAPQVDACLTAQVATWRFPTTTARKPATFRIRLQLAN